MAVNTKILIRIKSKWGLVNFITSEANWVGSKRGGSITCVVTVKISRTVLKNISTGAK